MSRGAVSPTVVKIEELDPVVLPEFILCPTATGSTVRGLLFHLHKAGTSSATLPLRLIVVEGEFSGMVYGKMTQLKDQIGFVGTAWMKILFERNQSMSLEDARTRLQMNTNLTLPLSKTLGKPLPSGLDPSRLLVDPKDFSLNPIERLSPEDLSAFLARLEPFCGGPPLRKKDAFNSIIAGSRKRFSRQFLGKEAGGGVDPTTTEEGEETEMSSSSNSSNSSSDNDSGSSPGNSSGSSSSGGISGKETPSTPRKEKKEDKKLKLLSTPTTPREKDEIKSTANKKANEETKLSPVAVGKGVPLVPRRLSYLNGKNSPTATRCAVCWSEDSHALIQCNKCMYAVHSGCYGNPLIRMSEEEQKSWVCESCQSGDTEMECVLCLGKNGMPLKRTIDSRWCHMMCAYYTPQVSFVFPVSREPIQNRLVRHSKCFSCLKSTGACVTCHLCSKNFHIPCVLRKHNPFVRQSAIGLKPDVQGKMLLNDIMIVFNCGTHSNS